MKCTGQDVIRIVRLLEDRGVPVWVDGGWGIDALLTRETRTHKDMDLVVRLDDVADAESILDEAGFAKSDYGNNPPSRLVFRNADGLEIDIHPVTFKPDGSAVHIDVEAGTGLRYPYVYSATGLSGVGQIEGHVVRCTTAAERIRQAVERRYSPWSKTRIREHGVSADVEDICSLLQVFGIAEVRSGEPGMAVEARAAGNPVVDAAEQFCLRHVAELNAQHSRLTAQHAELSERYAELSKQQAQRNAENAELMAQIVAMRASTCWQLTAPLRWTATLLGMRWLKLRTQ